MTENLSGLSAELLVASLLVRDGWNIYSPHRDLGFDFIATKRINGSLLLRPIQVRGCYLESRTKINPAYGKEKMELSALHDEMALVIPFYSPDKQVLFPCHIAFMPRVEIRKHRNRETYYSKPAQAKNGEIKMRREFRRYFDQKGIQLMSDPNWRNMKVEERRASRQP